MSFDTGKVMSSNLNIENQRQQVESFEIMMIGLKSQSVNRLFSCLCGLQILHDFSVYPKKGIESNLYFHLTPNISDIRQLKTIIDSCIYGSFQQINKIVFVFELHSDQNDKLYIRDLQQIKKFMNENPQYCEYITFMLTYHSSQEKMVDTNIRVYSLTSINIPLIYINSDNIDQQYIINQLKTFQKQLLTIHNLHIKLQGIMILNAIKYTQNYKFEFILKIIKIKFLLYQIHIHQ